MISKNNQRVYSVKDYLQEYSTAIIPFFDSFFIRQKNEAEKISEVSKILIQNYQNFMGGKHIRGALTKLGYEMISGDRSNNEDIMKASMIVEIIHAFLLMHDDFMDQDETRRGKPTMHMQYEKIFEQNYPQSAHDKRQFGSSMAVLVGDLAPFFSNLIIRETHIEDPIKLKFLSSLSDTIMKTIYGQAMDISYEQEQTPTEDKVMAIHKYKTSYYTISGPLQCGAILAGIDNKDARFASMEKFGQAAGIAFQLKDDELGMFSDQEKIGKPVYSDLRQGKNTLLFAKAFEKADKNQYHVLRRAFGNKSAAIEDMDKVKDILIATGSLDHSRKLTGELIGEAKRYIKEITNDKHYQGILETLLDYIINREK